ncbi:hypothetical protein IQ255_16425 [Pleurocapsales cyanobacterium LEGE 10410]|nr:hypothetical protein [Pleurocapsales cyanobacterium LEGE 10410]
MFVCLNLNHDLTQTWKKLIARCILDNYYSDYFSQNTPVFKQFRLAIAAELSNKPHTNFLSKLYQNWALLIE